MIFSYGAIFMPYFTDLKKSKCIRGMHSCFRLKTKGMRASATPEVGYFGPIQTESNDCFVYQGKHLFRKKMSTNRKGISTFSPFNPSPSLLIGKAKKSIGDVRWCAGHVYANTYGGGI